MNLLGNIIVCMWFIPVTLFIFIPLVLLGGHLFLTGVRHLTGEARDVVKQHQDVDDKTWA